MFGLSLKGNDLPSGTLPQFSIVSLCLQIDMELSLWKLCQMCFVNFAVHWPHLHFQTLFVSLLHRANWKFYWCLLARELGKFPGFHWLRCDLLAGNDIAIVSGISSFSLRQKNKWDLHPIYSRWTYCLSATVLDIINAIIQPLRDPESIENSWRIIPV